MSAAGAALTVDSVTGVEVALAVAGPGARAYAFVIDWVIRAILAVAWFAVGMVIYNGDLGNFAPPLETDGYWLALVAVPAGSIYLLYHPILEIFMHGRTPGKRIAGVRLTTRSGGAPAFGAHLIRNVFRVVDNFPICYGLGLVMTMVTYRHVRLGDLAAGTLLVYERADTVLFEHIRNAALGPRRAEIINELLSRWEELDSHARRRLGTALVGEAAPANLAALRERLEQLARGGDQ